MTDLRTALFGSIILLIPICVHAQIGGSTSPDPRVRRALEQEGLNYEVDDEGDFRTVIEVEDGRTQNVWIMSSTRQAIGLEVREVFSAVYVQEENEPVPDRIAQWALQKNPSVGSLRSSGNGIVFFSLKIDATASIGTLASAVYGVAGISDDYEQEISINDDL